MATVDEVLGGAGRRRGDGPKQAAGPRAPVNLGLWDLVAELRNTIDTWAGALLRYALPGAIRRAEDWVNARLVFQRFAQACGGWTESWRGQRQETGVMCIDEVLYAVHRLNGIVNPRQVESVELARDEAEQRLESSSLTIRALMRDSQIRNRRGAQARHGTGMGLPRKIETSIDEGTGAKLYPVAKLIDMARQMKRERMGPGEPSPTDTSSPPRESPERISPRALAVNVQYLRGLLWSHLYFSAGARGLVVCTLPGKRLSAQQLQV